MKHPRDVYQWCRSDVAKLRYPGYTPPLKSEFVLELWGRVVEPLASAMSEALR